MWRSKKFIIIAVLAAVLLAGSIGGVALAGNGNGHDGKYGACQQALLEEACNILNSQGTCTNITPEQLRDALRDAREAVADECQRPKRFSGQGDFGACREALLNNVCDYLNSQGICTNITPEQLEAALADAREAVADECQRPKRLGGQGDFGACRETLLNNVCDYLNDQGICTNITPEQLEAAFADARSQMPDECQRPKRPGPGGFRGMGGMRGFGGPFAPAD